MNDTCVTIKTKTIQYPKVMSSIKGEDTYKIEQWLTVLEHIYFYYAL